MYANVRADSWEQKDQTEKLTGNCRWQKLTTLDGDEIDIDWSGRRWTAHRLHLPRQRRLCKVLIMRHRGDAPIVAAASTAIKAHRWLAKTCTSMPWRLNTGNLVARHMHSMPGVVLFMHGWLLLDVQKTCIEIRWKWDNDSDEHI
jgi:hypothetical protein